METRASVWAAATVASIALIAIGASRTHSEGRRRRGGQAGMSMGRASRIQVGAAAAAAAAAMGGRWAAIVGRRFWMRATSGEKTKLCVWRCCRAAKAIRVAEARCAASTPGVPAATTTVRNAVEMIFAATITSFRPHQRRVHLHDGRRPGGRRGKLREEAVEGGGACPRRRGIGARSGISSSTLFTSTRREIGAHWRRLEEEERLEHQVRRVKRSRARRSRATKGRAMVAAVGFMRR